VVEAVSQGHVGDGYLVTLRRQELASGRLQPTVLQILDRRHAIALAELPQKSAGAGAGDLDELVEGERLGQMSADELLRSFQGLLGEPPIAVGPGLLRLGFGSENQQGYAGVLDLASRGLGASEEPSPADLRPDEVEKMAKAPAC